MCRDVSHLYSKVLHKSSPGQGFQSRTSKSSLRRVSGYFQNFGITKIPNCSELLTHIVLAMAKAHVAFEAMELLETRFYSKILLFWNLEI